MKNFANFMYGFLTAILAMLFLVAVLLSIVLVIFLLTGQPVFWYHIVSPIYIAICLGLVCIEDDDD